MTTDLTDVSVRLDSVRQQLYTLVTAQQQLDTVKQQLATLEEAALILAREMMKDASER
jgi:hypothetical protein